MVRIRDISVSDANFQRPYDPKRVAEIKNYVLGKDKLYKKGRGIFAKGYIPNAIVLNLSTKYKLTESNSKYYIEFPDTENLPSYEESIEVIDGQHRLLAFDDECKTQMDGAQYQMCFVAFIDLMEDEKKEIFMVLNERQKTVDKNILLRHKKLLHLLLEEEETRYDIISRLNSEKDSPFYDKIIMAGEKKKYGLKANQVDLIFNTSKALERLIDSKGQITEKKYKVLNNYFVAWRQTFNNVWFVKNNTLTKIAGFRFLCYLFPHVYDLLRDRRDYQVSAFKKVVEDIRDNEFNEEFDMKAADKFYHFQEKSGIIKLATQIGKELVEQHQSREDDIIV
ncbi:hypothetical protein ES707_06257 [subsurface metagenome]